MNICHDATIVYIKNNTYVTMYLLSATYVTIYVSLSVQGKSLITDNTTNNTLLQAMLQVPVLRMTS